MVFIAADLLSTQSILSTNMTRICLCDQFVTFDANHLYTLMLDGTKSSARPLLGSSTEYPNMIWKSHSYSLRSQSRVEQENNQVSNSNSVSHSSQTSVLLQVKEGRTR